MPSWLMEALMAAVYIMVIAGCGLAAKYLVPWAKAKLGDRTYDALIYWVGVLVRAAEQTMRGSAGEDKLAWVKEQLVAMGLMKDDETAVEANALIESEVLMMNKENPMTTAPVVVNMGEVTAEASLHEYMYTEPAIYALSGMPLVPGLRMRSSQMARPSSSRRLGWRSRRVAAYSRSERTARTSDSCMGTRRYHRMRWDDKRRHTQNPARGLAAAGGVVRVFGV